MADRTEKLLDDTLAVAPAKPADSGSNTEVMAGSPDSTVSGAGLHSSFAVADDGGPEYEMLGEVARGGMGVVYKARQKGLDRIVALKMILSGRFAGPEQIGRFRIEAKAAAQLRHPGIVAIHDCGTLDGHAYFTMEFVEGPSLSKLVETNPLPGRQAAALVEAVSRAVHYAHQQGVLHRDLKPANVLLSSGSPKVTDFGLAKVADSNDTPKSIGVTETGAILGTPSYMAPEQAEGRTKEFSPATDVYGLGGILYELLTGHPPFRGENPIETIDQVLNHNPVPPRLLRPGIELDLEKIALKCLEKKPALRYASAEDLAEDLKRYLADEPVQARSINLLERLARELAHSQHDQSLRPWGIGLMLLSGLIFAVHLAISLLLLAGYSESIAFWLPRLAMVAGAFALLFRFRPHGQLMPTNALERQIWAIWIGYFLAFGALFWSLWLMNHQHLEVYGAGAALGGLAWFALGGQVWGGCYLIGLTFFLLAPLLALMAGSVWSPFYFGLMWTASLGILGHRYWRSAPR